MKRASVVRPVDGWVATIRGRGDWREAEKALTAACVQMRGDGIDVATLDLVDAQAAAHVPRVIRRPSDGR